MSFGIASINVVIIVLRIKKKKQSKSHQMFCILFFRAKLIAKLVTQLGFVWNSVLSHIYFCFCSYIYNVMLYVIMYM